MKIGITLGRFMPLTKGHEFMLHTAWANSDHLTVLLGDSIKDCFTYEQRYTWVHNYLNSLPKIMRKSWEIIRDPDYDRPVTSNASGTITDETFWDFWMGQNSKHLGFTTATHVFTSDRYGAEIADQINRRWPRTGPAHKTAPAKWFPVNPDRELFPISATMVRTAPHKHFSMVSDWAKPSVGLTVAVLGA
jgi:HTH-type transcriptional repressor of NAD biosynthesis genes